MPEVRVTHLIGCVAVLVIIAIPVLAFFGFISWGWLNRENLTRVVDEGLAGASGYTKAKTPTDALDHFRTAIQSRKYKYAAFYCTKGYADLLNRGHASGAQLGEDIDQIHKFGDNGGILSDRVKIALLRLDPFPKNFKVGSPPEEKKDGKAYGTFEWEPIVLKSPPVQAQLEFEVKQSDPIMFSNVLTWKGFFVQGQGGRNVVLVKEGDEWKIDVPVDADWDRAVRTYDDKYKTYHSGLSAFIFGMTRERYADTAMFEGGVMEKLRAASK